MIDLLKIVCLNIIPMLTRTDLKAIESLFDRKFDEKFDEKFSTKFKLAMLPIRKDLKAMENRLTKRINRVADYFDEAVINHEKRIRNLESLRPALA